MAQGKKYDEEIRVRAFAMLGAGKNCAYVAKALELPYSTVKTWEKNWLRESEKKSQAAKNEAVSVCGEEVEGEQEEDFTKQNPLHTSSVACGSTFPNGGRLESVPHSPNGYEETNIDGMNLAELRQKKKEQFADDAWRMIDKTRSLLERRLDRAIEDEDKLDALLCEFENIGSEGNGKSLTDAQLRDLYRRFAGLKLEDARSLSTILGTLYDKQALANKEATQILGGGVGLLRWEDM